MKVFTLSAVDLVLSHARATVGASESPAASNAGPYVERVQKRVGLVKGQPWCAAYVADVGCIALGDDGTWPLPLVGGCASLGDFAKRHSVLKPTAEIGDVFLIWSVKLGRYAHAGFVVGSNNDTISANTTAPGAVGNSREGWLVAHKRWPFTSADRFVRWTDLLVP